MEAVSTLKLAEKIRVIPDFPKEGIIFRDITTLLRDGEALRTVVDVLSARFADRGADLVVGIESRGFIFGAPIAYKLGAGYVPIRKPGKLPAETISVEYALEYGTNALEVHRDAVTPGQRVLVVDDLLATGGTVNAAIELVEKLGGTVVGVGFVIELVDLHGRDKLGNYDVVSLLTF